MTPETLFSICSTLVLPGWLLLIFAPRWKWTTALISSVLIPGVLLGIIYTTLIVTNMPGAEGGFGSLDEVRTLFQNPWMVLAGWIHYLAFDLFIGSWMVRDAQRHKVRHLLVVPCLLGCFILGPFGLLLYLVLRAATKRVYLFEDA